MKQETILQKAILDLLAHIPNTYFFRASSGLIKTQIGNYFRTGKKGLPDICGVMNGKFYGIEVKFGKNKLSTFQKQAQEEIEKAGGIYVVAYSIDNVIEGLNL
jgi:hypothetical protein